MINESVIRRLIKEEIVNYFTNTFNNFENMFKNSINFKFKINNPSIRIPFYRMQKISLNNFSNFEFKNYNEDVKQKKPNFF